MWNVNITNRSAMLPAAHVFYDNAGVIIMYNGRNGKEEHFTKLLNIN